MEEIFFCMMVEFLFVSIGFLIMGEAIMIYLFPFDSKDECIFSSIIIFFILACVWILAREIYHQFVLEDGKGIITWFLQKRK
ncbi:TPA: hypothetical protein ACGVYF_000977 [Enterococcus faecium]|uniref:Uncharacterized protein n=1 Tax=Enterococcus faecium TaxID=1352 RepID=A0A7V7Y2S7_ENTFC|nr:MULTISPECIES: hypothetical protein [Enterococcus]MBU5529210.1 hypothetical protein [Enterococcus sp. S109_ASV_20]MBU5534756.1 hypothetical protein [Enterococcus sp. S105_ASV_20]MBU5549347.1 hypothetical protein [Enterococcus sp. S101_ASV_20]MDK7597480.1 hypothetical protein [Enterococcus sp. UMB1061]OFU68646.1 hypothetical protein HMPREF3128_01395 [Enterococcus sp. HMSC14A10]